MDSKSFSIGFLSVTAVLLLVGIWSLDTTPAHAAVTERERDFQIVTCRAQAFGDALYILDNRSGMMAVFGMEPGRGLQPRAVGRIGDAFAAPR